MSRTLLSAFEAEFRKLRSQAERALEQLEDTEFFSNRQGVENSVAVVVKHIAGNQRSRWTDFLTTDGEKPGRDRDGEFEINPQDDRASLMAAWELGWTALEGALAELADDSDLERTVTIRGEEHSVLEAILRQTTHYAVHVGQVVLLAKAFRGESWDTLSIPRGGSAEFNRSPSPYRETSRS